MVLPGLSTTRIPASKSTCSSECCTVSDQPRSTFPQVGEWATAVQNVGIPLNKDPFGGQNWGAGVSTSAINPSNWTRSYSRSGYLDPLPPRANYDVLVNAHVSRIIFNSASTSTNLTASAVEYSRDGGKTVASVKVNKEVILAGGTVGSPHVLMNSGVGPRDILAAAGIDVLSELPGVGQNLQDHLVRLLLQDTRARLLT